MAQSDYLFRGDIDELDPAVAELIRHETARQQARLILIPSESTVPHAVRHALSSAFHNIYAEGYPLENTRKMSERELLDYERRLPEFRRNADQRYYKGTEYANIIESLARRRAAELFAGNGYVADDLYVNVQPLSGAPANNAVYTALLEPGDTVMGMDLFMGGHLTHGSPVNRSGKFHNVVGYTINARTGRLDYDAMLALAREHRPKLIIGGFSSYPFAADWHAYREIADAVGAVLLADIAHVAGMVAAEAYPNPVGIADVVSFTSHKTLNGPRGALLITHDRALARKLDRAVFPGEQGGPHINTMAALAVALRLARTQQFRDLQRQTVTNAGRLADRLAGRGFNLPHGGTDTHLLLLDCKDIKGEDGTALSGDMAARILDLAGIVVNRQTVPGDRSALRPSGIRIGTPWITQRGFGDSEIDQLSDIIADLLFACQPFSLTGRIRPLARAKVDFDALQAAREKTRQLAEAAGIDTDAAADDYPHFHYLEAPESQSRSGAGDAASLVVKGEPAADFLQLALTSDVAALEDGESQATQLLEVDGSVMASGSVQRLAADSFRLSLVGETGRALEWLRALSDGFVTIDRGDLPAKLPGPVAVTEIGDDADMPPVNAATGEARAAKAWHIGINGERYAPPVSESLPKFEAEIAAVDLLRETPLHSAHQELGAKMAPFAGYDMPLWYKSVSAEHAAVRQSAGVFDVAHMGVYDIQGRGAAAFLDAVTTNDVRRLKVGRSHYAFLLDVAGQPFDDLMIYRLAAERYLLVVNAANNDKNWAWLNAVIRGQVMIDSEHPARRIEGTDRFQLRDLRLPMADAEQRVDIALQGPRSRDILLSLGGDLDDLDAIKRMTWAGVRQATLGGFDLIVARTGYTGERMAYELFPHPDQAAALFTRLMELGATPCGLAARDSLRVEAGLPLYGYELAGEHGLDPGDAGFAAHVKLYKPFFVGKRAFAAAETARRRKVRRFRAQTRGGRPAHCGDPIVDERGVVAGVVTSCARDESGHAVGLALMRDGVAGRLLLYPGAGKAKGMQAGSGWRLGERMGSAVAVELLGRFRKG